MLIAKVTDGQIIEVAHYREFYKHRDWRFEAPSDLRLSRDGYMKVNMQVPYDSATQKLEPCDPYIEDGYVRTVKAVAKTAEDLAAEAAQKEQRLRDRRNRLLAESDWVVIMHTEKGTNIPLEWEVYRQALRDITSHPNWPDLQEADMEGNGGDWPVVPS